MDPRILSITKTQWTDIKLIVYKNEYKILKYLAYPHMSGINI